MPDLDIIRRAREFAVKAHGDQLYGNLPYLYHLEHVQTTLSRFGHDGPELQAAALLHDTLEDTATNYNDLRVQFGFTVAELVYAVTDELGRNRDERHDKTYPKIAAMPDALVLKLADRIANVEHSITAKDVRKLAMYCNEHREFGYGIDPMGRGPKDMWDYLNMMLRSGTISRVFTLSKDVESP
jgi:(p)ppGpp synthase/HD superfamily hydrolase